MKMLNSKAQKAKRLPKRMGTQKFKWRFNKRALDKVLFLLQEVSYTEWCGHIYYQIVKGDITDISTMEIEIIDIFPLSIDTPGYTEANSDISRLAIPFEGKNSYYSFLEPKIYKGFIHSHHNMGTTFSGTDWDEFLDSSENYPFLSVIVNNKMIPNAHLGIKTLEIKEIQYPNLDNSGNNSTKSSTTFINTFNGTYAPIRQSFELDDEFLLEYKRMKDEEKVKKEQAMKKRVPSFTKPVNQSWHQQQAFAFTADEDELTELDDFFSTTTVTSSIADVVKDALENEYGIAIEDLGRMIESEATDELLDKVVDSIHAMVANFRYSVEEVCEIMDEVKIESPKLTAKLCQ